VTDGSIRSLNSLEGFNLSLRKMEKAMNARMTTPPTVPPTMRIVLVFTPDEEDWDCCAEAVAVDVFVVEGDVCEAVVMALMVGNAVGTGVLVV